MWLDMEGTCPDHGRVAAEQVGDGQLSSGSRGRGGGVPFWRTLGVERDPEKRQPHLELRWGLWCERDLVGGV